jgi:hypothetical protein
VRCALLLNVIDHYSSRVNICVRFLFGVVGVCLANRKRRKRKKSRMLIFISVIAVMRSFVIVLY